MDGIILINKEKGYTSRDVVNIISHTLNTRKVGHFGTLDPLATGLLIIGVGKYTKFQHVLDKENKEYEVSIVLGKSTTTYDLEGKVVKEEKIDNISFDFLKEHLMSFKTTYFQEVPKYSAVKVNGKKLYLCARNNIEVVLPKKEVTIYDISDIALNKNILSFKCLVSKGCYIRSLVNDLSIKTNIPMCLKDLNRTKIDNFSINDSYTLQDIKTCNYKFYDINKLITFKKIEVDDILLKKILNGCQIENTYNEDKIIFTHNNKLIALYEKEDNLLKKSFYF